MDSSTKNRLLSWLFSAAILFADLSPYMLTDYISSPASYLTYEKAAQKEY